MSATALTPITLKGPFPVGAPGAGALDLTFTAGDNVNGNNFVASGNDLLLVKNTHATLARTFTITSQPDRFGRSQDIAAYSVAAGTVAAFDLGNGLGWVDPTTGKVTLACSTADISFAVLRRTTP